MKKRPYRAVILAVIFTHGLASVACGDPIGDFFSTLAARDSGAETAYLAFQTETEALLPIQTFAQSATPDAASSRAPSATLEKDRFVETAGATLFSYIPPPGWNQMPPSGEELMTSWMEPSECCLLHFFSAVLDIPAEQYALTSLELKKEQLQAEVISQGKFENEAGLDAYKVVMAYSYSEGINQQVTQYFFQSRGFLIVATYIRGYHERKDLDPVVDVSMRTLREG